MNTRLQVEHGVTELVTGLDLVGLQLAVAAGRPLPFGQADVSVRGHAVEVRLCAERPREDYRPTPGTATHVRWPEGPGLRDRPRPSSPAASCSAAYDSLVAKLMAHGQDRDAAIARLALALRALELDGLETNRDLLGRGARRCRLPARRGRHPLPRAPPDLRDAELPDAVRRRHAAAVAFCLTDERAAHSLVPVPRGGMAQRRPPPPRRPADGRRRDDGGARRAPGEPAGARRRRVAGRGHGRQQDGVVDLVADDGLRRRYRVRHSAHRADVNGPEGQSTFALRTEDDPDERGGVAGECRAPLPGAVTKVLVAVGDTVAEGDGLVVLEAMKMEHTLRANGAGTVAAIHCAPGQQVDVNDLLVVVEPA